MLYTFTWLEHRVLIVLIPRVTMDVTSLQGHVCVAVDLYYRNTTHAKVSFKFINHHVSSNINLRLISVHKTGLES